MESLKEKILIVDDDENICEVIRIYLESANYDVKTIHDGGMVQGIFMRYKPDLVILDMMLPNIEGIDLLKWIRKEGNKIVISQSQEVPEYSCTYEIELEDIQIDDEIKLYVIDNGVEGSIILFPWEY